MKLLIAEDDKTSRLILDSVCTKWGYDVVCVEDGLAAWEVMQQEDRPQIMVIDWEMPHMSGIELCQLVSDKYVENPPYMILLTSRYETQDIVEGLKKGANDYIAKPFNNDELRVRISVGKRMIQLQNKLNDTLLKLTELASKDALTGMLNRRAIMEALSKEIKRTERQEQILCIGMCDIDHFKLVNDNYGHLVGDEVLKEVAKRMQGALRVNDVVGRYGGEEFLIVTPVDCMQNAGLVYQRICDAVSGKPIVIGEISITVTLSCGIANYIPAEDRQSVEKIISRADIGLYKAKEAGRNQVVSQTL